MRRTASGLLLQPRLLADGHTTTLGTRPIGLASWEAEVSVDYRFPAAQAYSFDATFNALGRRPARLDGSVTLPTRTLLDIGARYLFNVGRHAAELRAQIRNLFDVYSYSVDAGEGLYYEPSRRWRLVATVDL